MYINYINTYIIMRYKLIYSKFFMLMFNLLCMGGLCICKKLYVYLLMTIIDYMILRIYEET